MGKRKVASLAFTGVAGVGMAAFAAGPAFATGGTWTVTPTGAYTATTSKTTLGAAIDLTCASATAKGSVPTGTGASSTAPVATITSAKFDKCTGLAVSINAKLLKTAYLWASKATASGKTAGFIAGSKGKATSAISASLSGSTLGAGCHAKVVGSYVPGSYSNTNHKLNVNLGHAKTLTIKSVKSCTGLADGSAAYFSAAYTVNPALTLNNT
jgi:hypothetical protein